MARIQEMIDELERKAIDIQNDMSFEEQELMALSAKARELKASIDAKQERKHHYLHAISNLRAVQDIENPQPTQTDADPWGNAN